jgi:hypothetical protein
VRLIVWCKACGRQTEPDPAEQAARYGADYPGSRLAQAAGLLGLPLARYRLCAYRRLAVNSSCRRELPASMYGPR